MGDIRPTSCSVHIWGTADAAVAVALCTPLVANGMLVNCSSRSCVVMLPHSTADARNHNLSTLQLAWQGEAWQLRQTCLRALELS